MTIRDIWRRLTATRYTRALEAEVARQGAELIRQGGEIARLRGENRALLNSILGIAGIPPIPVDSPDVARGLGEASSAPANGMNDGAVPQRNRTDRGRTTGDAQVATPMRRRSWQQITRMLEFEAARKAVTSD